MPRLIGSHSSQRPQRCWASRTLGHKLVSGISLVSGSFLLLLAAQFFPSGLLLPEEFPYVRILRMMHPRLPCFHVRRQMLHSRPHLVFGALVMLERVHEDARKPFPQSLRNRFLLVATLPVVECGMPVEGKANNDLRRHDATAERLEGEAARTLFLPSFRGDALQHVVDECSGDVA